MSGEKNPVHVIGRLADFPVGEMTIVDVAGVEVGVYHGTDGRLHAVRNVCPHYAAPICRGTVSGTMVPSSPGVLEYGLDEQVLRCPWHGFEYDLTTGRSVFGTTRGRLRTYQVTVTPDDHLELRL